MAESERNRIFAIKARRLSLLTEESDGLKKHQPQKRTDTTHMKKTIFLLLLLVSCSLSLRAQTDSVPRMKSINPATTGTTAGATPRQPLTMDNISHIRIGYLSYDSLLHQMPEYRVMEQSMQKLRGQYEAETAYNEENFKRMFTDFLQGQKDFPQPILLKRQQDLQVEMEKSLAFRNRCDSLLRKAKADMMAPLHQKLQAAIRAVGLERDYEMIVNTDAQAVPFLRPAMVENAAPYVWQKLQ